MRGELGRVLVGGGAARWRIAQLNADFSLCATYPASLAVPAAVDDATLVACAKYRSKGALARQSLPTAARYLPQVWPHRARPRAPQGDFQSSAGSMRCPGQRSVGALSPSAGSKAPARRRTRRW